MKSTFNPEHPLLIDRAGHSGHLLGNEAIVRGALEAGVAFASGYPGTPASEIGDAFARISAERGIVFEYSVNEKLALEMAFAASLAGARSICSMKHLGLLVAGDPLSTVPYIGVEAGMVIVSAADPGCKTSPNEQDQRHLGPMLHLPILDPSTPQQALTMARFAFELSEKTRLPVLLRPTTRVCHTRGTVTFGSLRAPSVRGFVRDPQRYVPVPHNAQQMRVGLQERIGRAGELMAGAGFFECTGNSTEAILAVGAPAATCADLLGHHALGDRIALWTLGAVYPLPEAQLARRLDGVDKVLVVEELSPFIEDRVRNLCAVHGLRTEILGQRTGHLSEVGEQTPERLEEAIGRALDVPLTARDQPAPAPVPTRPPTLCPGCPHRATFLAARAAFGEEQLYFNDIGCYTLGYGAPLDTADALVCMGAGFSLAAGVSRMTGQRTVGFLGDSTFFHAGMPALLNAVKEDVNMVAVVLDNQTTAMTGFQASPSLRRNGSASIEAVARALGASHVETVDSYDLPGTVAAFRRAREARSVSVIVVERTCPVDEARERGPDTTLPLFEIDHDRCRSCGRESLDLRCTQCVTTGFERQLARGCAARGANSSTPLAPCSTECPLSLCIQGYAGHIAAGEYVEAWGHIADRCALPESVCRVCHQPCEAACVRQGVDGSVAINGLKRFVVEWAADRPDTTIEPEREPAHGLKVAVAGAGPAGLVAARDLALRGYDVTLYDAAERPGGLLVHGIPAYRLPPEAVQRDLAQILDLGVRFVGNTRLGRDVTVAGLLEQGFDAVFLALGATRATTLDLAGADLPDSPAQVSALEYLASVARGAAVDTGRRVVVIGGGNAAIDAARTGRRLGAEQVTIACIEADDEMPAIRSEIAAAKQEGIAVRTGVRPVRLGSKSVCCAAIGDEVGAGEFVLDADQIVLAIGQQPDLDCLEPKSTGLTETDDGHIQIDPATGATSHPLVFAGGDLTRGERTVTGAIAAGQRAAWGIDRSLRGAETADRRPPPARVAPVGHPPAPAPADAAFQAARVEPHELPPDTRVSDFREVAGRLSEAEARAEASRCLLCGACGNCRACIDLFACPALVEVDGQVDIDADLCTGCAVCAKICPNDAIRMVARV
ncbi:MAG: FAD-dependent oxidoreductase [Vicinamibacterales bacterium]|nr:FAD-dependent oxidoreductase [Vicinamibacterales bacterium]MDP7670554.1 FAD-dependent oxidoreductase [Vicinamibacterales bacterium]HJO38211.1 FAD-dependent oxidoreductase [Vicinamibacterales bacterium]